MEAGTTGALAVLKMLTDPAWVAATLLGTDVLIRSIPHRVPFRDRLERSSAFIRQILVWVLGLVDLALLAVIILGVPFLAVMTR
jgi:hypothetical protein